MTTLTTRAGKGSPLTNNEMDNNLIALAQTTNSVTSSGTSTAYTITPSPVISAYAANQVFYVTFHTASGDNPTLQINGIATPPNLVRQTGSGSLQNIKSGDIPAGSYLVVGRSTTQYEVLGLPTAVAGPSNTQLSGLRNKFINGAMGIDQRNAGAAQTITAAAALAYTVDRWYGYCTGANVTGQRVAGTAPNKYNYRYTGAASVTKIAHAQRIEASNSQDLAGTVSTLSVDLANSLLTTVTWTAWYATSEDSFGTLASPTRTQIATGTFTVTSTLTRYSVQIAVPSAATTGIEVEFSVGAQTSGTWTIGRAQLEPGTQATPFEHRPIGVELGLCQRYAYTLGGEAINQVFALGFATTTTNAHGHVFHPVRMRSSPTLTISAAGDFQVSDGLTAPACTTLVTGGAQSSTCSIVFATVSSGLTASRANRIEGVGNTNARMYWSAEL